MQETPWYLKVKWLRVALAVWGVLLLVNLSLLIFDTSRWVQYGLQILVAVVFGLISAGQLKAALQDRDIGKPVTPSEKLPGS